MSLEFRGIHADIRADRSPERDVEGSLNSGKTTVCLQAEIDAIQQHAGIWTLLTRYSGDAVSTKLRPNFEQVCAIAGLDPKWDEKKQYYQFENGSRAYAFGLKAHSILERYEKIRGLPVSRIFNDQAEATPVDIANELRARLRPDLLARERGVTYPTQLTFSANPVPHNHWLAKQFPTTNAIKRRQYFCVSLMDNAHNLPSDTVEGMLQAYPPEHPKYKTMILGQRGANIIGESIYLGVYKPDAHTGPVELRPDAPVLEAFDVGKQQSCWLAAQRLPYGGLVFLGGIRGENLFLEDFLPIVDAHRSDWFTGMRIQTCCAPPANREDTDRYTAIKVLQEWLGTRPQTRENSYAADVQLAMIERLAGHMRRRNHRGGESLMVNEDPQRWWRASADELLPAPFMAEAFATDYTWDEHVVSVGNKEMRHPFADGWAEHPMRCAELIELNFCAGQETEAEQKRRRHAQAEASSLQMPTGPNAWLAY